MTLSPALISSLESRLQEANTSVDRLYPGEPQARQPVHTFYGGAHLFAPDICPKLGKLALRTLGENAPFPGVSDEVMARVRTKLANEPVEDYRIDFEDGYGNRPDVEEDGHAEAAARYTADALTNNLLPPFLGIRIKPFTEEHRNARYLFDNTAGPDRGRDAKGVRHHASEDQHTRPHGSAGRSVRHPGAAA